MAWDEILSERTRTGKKYQETGDPNRFLLELSTQSLHYQEDPDNPDDPWLDIDTAIVAGTSPWDYEISKNNWKLKIKEDTTVAVFSNSHWIGFKMVGFAYLEITTKNYTILGTIGSVTPTITSNSIRWDNIVSGINFVLRASNDYLKEEIEITQVARDWCVAHPPSSYGYVNADTYLVIIFECDWSNAGQAVLEDETVINLEDWEGDESIFFKNVALDKIIATLPLDHAYLATDPDNTLTIHKRFINSAINYLLLGVPVTDINALSPGTVIFDPTLGLYVPAGNCDASQIDAAGTMDVTNATYVRMYSSSNAAALRWGGFRFTASIAKGATINNCYCGFYVVSTTYDDGDMWLGFEKAAAPLVFTAVDFNISSRTITGNKYNLNVTGAGVGWYYTPGGSLTLALQEVITLYNVSSIVLLSQPILLGSGSKGFYAEPIEAGSGHPSYLYIDYTPPPCCGGGGMNMMAGATKLLIG